MTIKGGTSQACAACKYQRRRCTKDCALAPYFPADKPKIFQNAHRLFGVCNIMKILKQVHNDQKDEAMKSIKFESNMRACFPVHGCCEVICQLRFQLQQTFEELQYVNTRLAICKDQCHHYQIPTSPSDYSPPDLSQFRNNIQPVYHQYSMSPTSNHDHHFLNGNNGNVFVDHGNEDMMKPLRVAQVQYPYYNNICNNNNNPMMMVQSQLINVQQGFSIQQEMDVPYDYDDIPFDAIADDRQSYIESKEACESSAESALKDTTQSLDIVTENELKGAAACFSLTN